MKNLPGRAVSTLYKSHSLTAVIPILNRPQPFARNLGWILTAGAALEAAQLAGAIGDSDPDCLSGAFPKGYTHDHDRSVDQK
jgi:hypothetical protein